MSLRPDDRSSRTRSKSGTRDRSRSRSNVRAPKAPSPPSAGDKQSRYAYPSSTQAPPSIMPGGFDNGVTSPSYEVRSPDGNFRGPSNYFPQAPVGATPYPPDDDDGFTMGDYTDLPPHERPGYIPPPDARHYGGAARHDSSSDEDLAYGATSREGSRHPSYSAGYTQQPMPGYTAKQQDAPSAQYRYTPQVAQGAQQQYGPGSYQPAQQYQYAQAPDKITYTSKPQTSQMTGSYSQTPEERQQLPRAYSQSGRGGSYSSKDARVVEITPGGLDPKASGSRSHRLSVSTQQPSLQPQPPSGLGARMDRLSVSGNRPDIQALGGGNLPPPSPLLEAYHGTYQSLSPMPGAMRLDDGDLDDLPPLGADYQRLDHRQDKLAQESSKRRVKIYDSEGDAKTISEALGHHHKIDGEAIVDVLTPLTHDQMLELAKEYKKQVKIQGKGVNLSKHLKMKLTGNFGKVAYVTALGRWESEGYWANFWYQSHTSRRELLIESLMGRTNAEMREIKDAFKDKRYSDSLTKCMEKELKMDKFRTAVLIALEGRRQEEQDVYPIEYRNRDVDNLNRIIRGREGGETAMLDIVMRRSDAHLREVLRTFQDRFGENFARLALKKSNNLVGEVIAHILNGVINKPARDSLLLHHAIRDIASKNKDDELRYELLISRLVRLHWDRLHLARVKREYKEKYGKYLEEDIEDATKGDFREFMCELCQTEKK